MPIYLYECMIVIDRAPNLLHISFHTFKGCKL